MELDELIRTRRTQKAYEPGPVDPATLDELFELAHESLYAEDDDQDDEDD